MPGSFVDSFLKGLDAGDTINRFRLAKKKDTDARGDIERERRIQKEAANARLGIPDFVDQQDSSFGANLPPGVQPIQPTGGAGGGVGPTQKNIAGTAGNKIPTSKNWEAYSAAAKRKIVDAGGGVKQIEDFDTAFREKRRRGANLNIMQAGNLVQAADAARAKGDIAGADQLLKQAKVFVEKGYGFMNNGTHLKANVVNGKLVGTFWDENTGKPKSGAAVIPINIEVLKKAASIFNDPEMFQAAELDYNERLRTEKIALDKEGKKLTSDEKRTGITAAGGIKQAEISAAATTTSSQDKLTQAREKVISEEKISKETLRVEKEKIEADFAKHVATIDTKLKAKEKTEIVSVINTVISDAQFEVLKVDNPLFAEIALNPGVARFALLEQTLEVMTSNDNLSVVQAVDEATDIFLAAINKGHADADTKAAAPVVSEKIKAGIPPPPSSPVPGGSGILAR